MPSLPSTNGPENDIIGALEKAEYEFAMAKGILDQFLTDDMKDSIGYCKGQACGLCPMCRMNKGLNILKFSRLGLLPPESRPRD